MSETGAAEPAGHAHCDHELIHQPGSIQPHGTLVVAHPDDLTILQVAANTTEILGRTPDSLLGRPLDDLVGAEVAARIAHDMVEPDLPHLFDPVFLRLPVPTGGGRQRLSCLYHHYQGAVLVEFEPSEDAAGRLQAGLRWRLRAIARMAQAATPDALCAVIAAEIRALTGYDRVLVYRFAEDWHGEVVAESMAGLPVSYLGLHFPAADIPEPARRLYTRNRLRVVADVDYRPVPLLPEANPLTGRPLDMTYAFLRSVAPAYLGYLARMGVKATLTISLLVDGRLWGLIICHHETPFRLPVAERIACQEIGEIAASHLARLLERERALAAEERRHSEAAPERSREDLRDLRQLAGIAAEDLREPLRRVRAIGRALRSGDGAPLPEPVRDFVETATDAAERMQALLAGLQAFARIGTEPQRFQEVELAEGSARRSPS